MAHMAHTPSHLRYTQCTDSICSSSRRILATHGWLESVFSRARNVSRPPPIHLEILTRLPRTVHVIYADAGTTSVISRESSCSLVAAVSRWGEAGATAAAAILVDVACPSSRRRFSATSNGTPPIGDETYTWGRAPGSTNSGASAVDRKPRRCSSA